MASIQAPMQNRTTRRAHDPRAQIPNYSYNTSSASAARVPFKENTPYLLGGRTYQKNPFYGRKILQGASYKRAPELMNVPYGADQMDSWDPTGHLHGKFPPTHMEMPKPASQRNSAFSFKRNYGSRSGL